MKTLALVIALVALVGVVSANNGKLQCKIPPHEGPKQWITMVDPCTKKMKDQVQEELVAAMTYMAMGAHFLQDTVNRPGFAKMFLESASEERQHAIKVIEYLLMRGGLVTDISGLIDDPRPLKLSWESGLQALEDALSLESNVTNKIRNVIIECEQPKSAQYSKFNDYHLVDYLTGDFLEEQYRGQRDLAGKISTLGKMMKNHGALGEFLFDKKLLNGEL
jgi:ferritin heavy chain